MGETSIWFYACLILYGCGAIQIYIEADWHLRRAKSACPAWVAKAVILFWPIMAFVHAVMLLAGLPRRKRVHDQTR